MSIRLNRLRSLDEFHDYCHRYATQMEAHFARVNDALEWVDDQNQTRFKAFSYPAGRKVQLIVNRQQVEGRWIRNDRESFVCPKTGLNNRMRASIHLMDLVADLYPDSRIYLTEQVTSLFRAVQRQYPDCVGSEYLGENFSPGMVNAEGVRHEDLERLSFADQSFDLVMSFDVLEHVVDAHRSMQEVFRCLDDGGTFMWTAPFDSGKKQNTVRAVVQDDEIVHLMPPEYHGDPMKPDGVLCFRYFGWDVLDELREIGFQDAYVLLVHSEMYGYVGHPLSFVVAKKAGL